MHIQAFIAGRSAESLHEAVVGKASRSAEFDLDLGVIDPQFEQPPRELAPVVDEEVSWRLTPCYQLVEARHYMLDA
jgi:hypothetical protein